jgi:hypothetical protein
VSFLDPIPSQSRAVTSSRRSTHKWHTNWQQNLPCSAPKPLFCARIRDENDRPLQSSWRCTSVACSGRRLKTEQGQGQGRACAHACSGSGGAQQRLHTGRKQERQQANAQRAQAHTVTQRPQLRSPSGAAAAVTRLARTRAVAGAATPRARPRVA